MATAKTGQLIWTDADGIERVVEFEPSFEEEIPQASTMRSFRATTLDGTPTSITVGRGTRKYDAQFRVRHHIGPQIFIEIMEDLQKEARSATLVPDRTDQNRSHDVWVVSHESIEFDEDGEVVGRYTSRMTLRKTDVNRWT